MLTSAHIWMPNFIFDENASKYLKIDALNLEEVFVGWGSLRSFFSFAWVRRLEMFKPKCRNDQEPRHYIQLSRHLRWCLFEEMCYLYTERRKEKKCRVGLRLGNYFSHHVGFLARPIFYKYTRVSGFYNLEWCFLL